MQRQSDIRRLITRRSLLHGATLGAPFALQRAWGVEAPVAATKAGKIRGYVDSGINVFKGIPYGGDTARRRFLAPLPAKPWSGVRDCLEWGPQAPKPAPAPRTIGDTKAVSVA